MKKKKNKKEIKLFFGARTRPFVSLFFTNLREKKKNRATWSLVTSLDHLDR